MNRKTGFWITRLFLYIMAFSPFLGCQKDDDTSPPLQVNQTIEELKTTTRKVSADNIPDIMEYIAAKSDSRGQFTITKQNNDT